MKCHSGTAGGGAGAKFALVIKINAPEPASTAPAHVYRCLSIGRTRRKTRRTDWVTSILCLQCLRSRIHGELSAGRDRQVGKEEIPIVTGRISLHATDDAFTSGS